MIPHHSPVAGATFISGCSAGVGGSGQSSRSAGKSLGNTYVLLYQGFTWRGRGTSIIFNGKFKEMYSFYMALHTR